MDEATLQFYRSNAQSYADWAKAPSTRLRVSRPAAAGRAILELGCGAGNHSAVMLAEGFSVRATDGSPEMAEIASRRLGHPVEAMRFDQLDAEQAYDGVWASACAARAARRARGNPARIYRALKPSGVFYASYKMGENDGRDSLGRYYSMCRPSGWMRPTPAQVRGSRCHPRPQ
ncbi:class I SAM-dependent methyltransferase [Bradyrhizobium betae]|uniref:class I SAM-dependent methyltransferase n=1 Tax=Bradyrhizobium betae TaxID=244734 RepID=UPI0013867A45|nr:class I SAM-dependent methyltransferase [Bradyrhizobium betae]